MPSTKFTVTAIDTGTEIFTATGHNQAAGTPVTISATTTLPGGLTNDGAGLNCSIIYYIATANLTADAFSLVTAKDGSGTPVNITSTGAGTIYLQLNDGVQVPAGSVAIADGGVEISNVPLAVPMLITGLVVGARMRVSLNATGETLALVSLMDTSYSFTTKAQGLVDVSVRKASGSPKYKPLDRQGNIGATGMNLVVSMEEDPVA